QNYPNPFNPVTTIRYSVTEPSYVQIRMYDSSGRFIRTLANMDKSPGTYELRWDGRDSRGSAVASGVYFCRVRSGQFEAAGKIAVVK
ncbi:MAG: T9SS type A sorting domain-containing protein, partial [Candidatus Latescibacteria bacterium]|nr:T9SS type A sorting domain-containing protein [Candidatus Latescibacterota bacterium]